MKLKPWLPVLIILVCFLAVREGYSQKARQQCGFISEVSGKAVLQRGGKYYLVSGMEGVYCGESIRVLPGSRLVIAACKSNTRSEILGPAEFSITAQKLVFKSGSLRESSGIKPELCPFFMEQSFTNAPGMQVDAGGNNLAGIGEMSGTAVGMGPGTRWDGYLADVSGDVYFPAPRVRKLTGEIVPGEERVLVTKDGAVVIYSCGEGKRYQVTGPSLIQLRSVDAPRRPVTFLRGKPVKVEEIDRGECREAREILKKSGDHNLKPAGLDGGIK